MEQGEIEVLLELGQSYLLNKEYDDAIKKFSEALKINPHDPELYYYLGLAYEGSNKIKEAVDMYEKTLRLDKTFSNAEMRLNKLTAKMQEAAGQKKESRCRMKETRGTHHKRKKWICPKCGKVRFSKLQGKRKKY